MGWTYEQKFNSLNDGNLAGQDNFTAEGDSPQVQISKTFEGAKAISLIDACGADRALTGDEVVSGKLYYAIYCDDLPVGGGTYVSFYDGVYTNAVMMGFEGATFNLRYYDGTWKHLEYLTYDRWYVFEVEFDLGNNRWRYRHWDEVSEEWSTVSDWLGVRGSVSEVDVLHFGNNDGAITYIDTLTPTDPTIIPAGGRNFAQII